MLTAEGEDAWLRIKQHMEWCDSFALVFIFSDQPEVTTALRDRLAAIYRARVTALELPLPETADELLERLLPRLLHLPHYQRVLDAPIWLDLSRAPRNMTKEERAAWLEACLQFLARLNEQREALRRTLIKPLVLVLPLAEKARIKALVPDLWAIRHFSLQVGKWLVPQEEHESSVSEPALPEPFPLTRHESSIVEEWQRLQRKGSRDRSALAAGHRAHVALMQRGHISDARAVADWMATTARQGAAEASEAPEALRDLSISLDNVGNTDRALGELEAARAAFAEGLDIAQRMAAGLPNHVDYRTLPEHFMARLKELREVAKGSEQGFPTVENRNNQQ